MGSGGRPGAPTGLEATGTSVYTRGAVAQCTPLTCIQVGEGLEGFWLTRESAQSPALLHGQEGHQASSPSSQPLVVFEESGGRDSCPGHTGPSLDLPGGLRGREGVSSPAEDAGEARGQAASAHPGQAGSLWA